MVIQGEDTVKGEQWIVPLWQWPERKRPAVAGLSEVMCYGFVAFR